MKKKGLPWKLATNSTDVFFGDEPSADLYFHLSGLLLIPTEHEQT